MTSKRFLLLLTVALCYFAPTLQAQYNRPENRIWAMGNKVGLDFTTGIPVPITTSLANANEACASVCDTAGHLLFYTNGQQVWDHTGALMLHGNALIPANLSTLSTTQGAVIMPIPDVPNRYLLFSLTDVGCKLYSNVIDMSLNSGSGDVDTTYALRGTLIHDQLTEKMIAIAACDRSIWLLVHQQNVDSFMAYNVTSAGINTTPVSSYAGNFPGKNYLKGVMKISPDRTKLLNCNFATNGGLELFDFDFSMGIVANATILDSGSFYGGTFSPDNSKAYSQNTPFTGSVAYQYDLTAANPTQSRLLLGPIGEYTDMKIGPDAKIYFGALAGGSGYSNYRFLGCINFPNNAGVACGFQDSVTALTFPSGKVGALEQELPNEVVVSISGSLVYTKSLDTAVCTAPQNDTLHAPAGFISYKWDDGTTDSIRAVSQRGTYWVTAASPCYQRVDTFIIGGADLQPAGITVNGFVLGTTGSYATYQWYLNGNPINAADDSTYTVVQNGTYSVKVSNGFGCTDSTSYLVTNVSVSNVVLANAIKVYPNPATTTVFISSPVAVNVSIRSIDGKTVLQQGDAKNIDISQLSKGVYILYLSDKNGVELSVRKLVKAGL